MLDPCCESLALVSAVCAGVAVYPSLVVSNQSVRLFAAGCWPTLPTEMHPIQAQVRYVIDLFAGVPKPGGPPAAMWLDTRPALDSFGALVDCARMTARLAWSLV